MNNLFTSLLVGFSLLFVVGCAKHPGPDGATYTVGQATVIESQALDGKCTYTVDERKVDDGAKDDGKAEWKLYEYEAPAPCRIIAGGSWSGNMKAMVAGLFMLLMAL